MNLRLFALTALLLTDTANLAAQVASGTITGTITDSSNAAVPKANVRIINEDTAVARTMTTDTTGIYVARSMIPGRYRIEVGLTGFQPQAKTGLVLSLDQTMTVNFMLEPGQQQQVVTVVARSEQLVESATSSLGQIIEETQIRDLPLNGRNFQQLIGLNAGAQPGPQGGFSQGRYHLNGGRSEGRRHGRGGSAQRVKGKGHAHQRHQQLETDLPCRPHMGEPTQGRPALGLRHHEQGVGLSEDSHLHRRPLAQASPDLAGIRRQQREL